MIHIIDLTYDLEEGMPTFNAPWHVPVEVTQLGRHGIEGRETRKITFGTHTGTQVDAPLHFISQGPSIETIPLEKLIGPVTIVDFSSLGKNGLVTKDMLKRIRITPRMLFKFGWGKFWKTRQFYRDYPYFSEEAAHYLVDQKTELIALDTCSPDDSRIILQGNILGTKEDSPIHKILLGNGIVLVEYVANTTQLLDYENWSIVVMPLRIKGADGSPARVCIFREDENVIIKTSNFDQPSLTAKVPLAVVNFPQIKNAKLGGGSDLPVKKELSGSTNKKYRVEYDRPGCIGAGSCVAVQPERWVIRDENIENKADLLGGVEEKPGKWVLEFTEEEFEQFRSAATMCPVQVIKIFDIESGSQLTW